MFRTWLGEVVGERVHVVGQVPPDAADALHLRLAAEPALGADLARDARDLVGEGRELVDHRVDRLLELEHLALDVDGDLLRQVAVRDRRRDLGDVPHLAREVRRHEVDVLGEAAPRPADALDLGLAAEDCPSVPTSRATRVTSSANAESWSTIVLIVFLSSRTSPRASTVICCVRSPFATAVVTSAMFRTWLVRLPASVLTLSVSSRQTPETPSTSAWPPRRPSVPTSRATRVTSVGERRELVDHRVDRVLQLGDLACASTVIFRERSPFATAVVTSAMFRTWAVRFAGELLTLSVRSFQTPETPATSACPPSLPSRADLARDARHLAPRTTRSWSTIVLIVSLSSSTSPLTSTVILRERSPFATARRRRSRCSAPAS